MSEAPARKPPRVVLAAFPERYSLPARPSGGAAAVLDAHRQTNFLLGGDLSIFERTLNLHLAVVAANAKAKGGPAAALFTFCSRTFGHLADACTLMCHGSYASCHPLLRTALDCLAAQRSLVGDGFAEYEEWFASGISLAKEHLATAFDTGRYRAGSVLSADERLGPLYRLLTDLSMPHFGSTALLTAPESSPQKLSPAFADSAFHLGWAELIAGWLLLLAGEQLRTIADSGVFALDKRLRADCEAIQRESAAALESRRRCYVEELAGGGFVFQNWRRAPTGQPKRVVLG